MRQRRWTHRPKHVSASACASDAQPDDLIIAHRLSTIALADEIVSARRRTHAARGTHEELLVTSQVYRDIYEHACFERQFADAVELAQRQMLWRLRRDALFPPAIATVERTSRYVDAGWRVATFPSGWARARDT